MAFSDGAWRARGKRGSLRGGHASSSRDEIPPTLAAFDPIVENPSGMGCVEEDHQLLRSDVLVQPLEIGETVDSRPKAMNMEILIDDAMGLGDRSVEVPRVIESRMSLEKGKGIMISPPSPKTFLITPSSLKINGRDRSASPPMNQEQKNDGAHNNLVDKIMDALQKNNPDHKDKGDSENSSDKVESDEDMTLVQINKKQKRGPWPEEEW